MPTMLPAVREAAQELLARWAARQPAAERWSASTASSTARCEAIVGRPSATTTARGWL